MPLSILVTNKPPQTDNNVGEGLLELFQEYTRRMDDGKMYPPFRHQAEVFRLIERDHEVFLVAGTAAGKTLAVAVPLVNKLKMGRICKVLLMYPTIALMDDQRRVMDTLADIAGLEISQIQGGMSRTQLMTALNKQVILATPDEIYWFFRKNIKYSGLLIYGLALIDEFVLDEAHLFNGLMLQNLACLKERVRLLVERLGRSSCWHILTATPTHELRGLTDGTEVWGQSKCGDVEVNFLEPVASYADREDRLVGAVNTALTNGGQRVLLVLNSADLAHRLFEGIKGRSTPDLSPDLQFRLGRVPWGTFKVWLEQQEIAPETLVELEQWLKREGPLYPKDLADGTRVDIPTEVLGTAIARLLERQAWAIKRLVYSAATQDCGDLLQTLERKLGAKGRLGRLLWNSIRSHLIGDVSAQSVSEAVDSWCGEIQGAVERIWTEENLTSKAPGFVEIATSLREAGLSPELGERITNHLKYTLELPEETILGFKISAKELAQRRVAFSWLRWLIKDESRREALIMQVKYALQERRLEVEIPHVATWGDSTVPVVIYTGKMSKVERKGLIAAFAVLPMAVLISTSAVEVGVDFAADTMITEQCNGSSFLQRFGRVGRRSRISGKVVVLVKDGETYVRLGQRHQPQMSREEFSAFIADPTEGLFPSRLYAEDSVFLKATHWLVNAQLGQIGGWMNQALFGETVTTLGQKLKAIGLPFAYGLRGTLPGVSLKSGTAGGEPFYILRKVANERLVRSDSPFEMAQADIGYMEFLWKKPGWKAIVVHTQATLEASQALFWLQDGLWRVLTGHGVAADYVKLFSTQLVSKGQHLGNLLKALESRIKNGLEALLAELQSQTAKPLPQLLLRLGEALPVFFEPHNRFILGQGDVYLLRLDQEEITQLVEDRLGNPLVLPDQRWLVLFGQTKEEAQRLLETVSALDLEEVIYDWQTVEIQGAFTIGPVLLERVAGACFYVYERLVAHVSG